MRRTRRKSWQAPNVNRLKTKRRRWRVVAVQRRRVTVIQTRRMERKHRRDKELRLKPVRSRRRPMEWSQSSMMDL